MVRETVEGKALPKERARAVVFVYFGLKYISDLESVLAVSEREGIGFIAVPHGEVADRQELVSLFEAAVMRPTKFFGDAEVIRSKTLYLDSTCVRFESEPLASGEFAAKSHIEKGRQRLIEDMEGFSFVLLDGTPEWMHKAINPGPLSHGLLLLANERQHGSAMSFGKSGRRCKRSQVGEQLCRYFGSLGLIDPRNEEEEENFLVELLLWRIEEAVKVSFHEYKLATIKRRISHRISQLQMKSLAEFIDYVHRDPGELEFLYESFMIGVTRFFRDEAAFAALETVALPDLFAAAPPGGQVRIWVAGVATGEEAYSIAILCDEYLRKNPDLNVDFKIFATDAHVPSIEKGKTGFYEPEALETLSPMRLSRYFTRHNRRYQVTPEIRGRVVFAAHNLLTDAPFTQVDLVACRNVLIYFDEEAQKNTLGLLLFAMRGEGYLLLGSSESPIDFIDHLEPANARSRLFKRRGSFEKLPQAVRKVVSKSIIREESSPAFTTAVAPASLKILLDRVVELHMPNSLILDGEGVILQTFGSCERYFTKLSGKVSLSYKLNLQEPLRVPLQHTLSKARESGAVCRFDGCVLEDGGVVNLVVEPLPGSLEFPSSVFVAFETETASKGGGVESPGRISTASERELFELRNELVDTKFKLQDTIRQLELSNNDLQIANEELMTSNEELQSTNEELHSVNEELYSVNAEFEQKNADLYSLNEDVNNLLQSTQIGTVFIDENLRIRKFTPAASAALHLLPTDAGRPISHISHRFEEYAEMVDDAQSVLDTGEAFEREARTQKGGWLLVRILPYVSDKSEKQGAVITFIDISALKRAEDYILENQRKLSLALEAADYGLWTWDLEHGFSEYDERFFSLLGLSNDREEERDAFLRQAGFGPEFLDRFRVDAISGTFQHAWNVVMKNGDSRYLNARGIVYRDERDQVRRIGGVIWDETDLKRQEQLILQKKNDLETLLYVVSHDLREPLRAVHSFSKLLRKDSESVLGRESLDFLRRIEGGARRMSHLLDDVLDLSRINQMDAPTDLVEGRDLVAAVLRTLDQKISETAAQIIVSSDLPKLRVNFVYAKQALYNLVSNALKFVEEGEVPKIEITPFESSNGLMAGFVVRDRGPGIGEDCRERVFKLFQRAVGREVEGTGAGLAIVKQVALKHGGDVWYEPRHDGGAKFTLAFAK